MTDDIHRRVFIKNIPYEINDDALSEWCSSFGPITNCALKRDRFGNSRGFAFVTFATIDGHDNISQWKKQGYENLCCLRCIQPRDTNFNKKCICRVPKEKLEEGKVVECVHCGCRGCSG
ncbi:unnamed protein product [Rotaria sp. Silwood2]|nr:unnamed protein product [Rotaria sp. Silwood2]